MVQSCKDWTCVSFDVGRQTLRDWRDRGARRSEEVVELWEHVISRDPSNLGDELWVVYEQVCVAALDCARMDLSTECMNALDERFPKSNRVLKLQAMRFEAAEQYDTANQLYDRLIEADPANNAFRKRKIALLITERKRIEAIKELNDYLKIFLNDSEAWVQLCDLFLTENDYAKAAHCIEECVLAAPLNTMYLRRLADIRYTQGGVDNVELARAYYEQAAKLNPNDLRALYGIVLCTTYMSTQAKGVSPDKKKESITAGGSAVDKLVARYEEADVTGENPEIPLIIQTVQQMKSHMSTAR